jgi:hypothetical protein
MGCGAARFAPSSKERGYCCKPLPVFARRLPRSLDKRNFAEISHKLRIFSCLDLIEPFFPTGEGFEDREGDSQR